MSDVEPTAAATTLPVATTHLHILRTTVAAIASQEIASLGTAIAFRYGSTLAWLTAGGDPLRDPLPGREVVV
jgi:hypothetical protein